MFDYDYVSYWKFLNDNAGAIQAMSVVLCVAVTVALIIITIKYISLTNRLANASESQLRFQRESEQARLKQEIIDGSLKFIFRLKDDIDNTNVKKAKYLRWKVEFPKEQDEIRALEREFINASRKLSESRFMPELMFVAFQLQRLENIDLWEDFEQLGNLFDKLIKVLLHSEDLKEYDELYLTLKDKKRGFEDKCFEICRVGSSLKKK